MNSRYRLGAETNAAAGEAWYRTPVARTQMKELMQRSDKAAIRDTLLWYALILASGWLAYLSVGTGWAVPAFFLYGSLYAGPADSRWHEAGHGTAFRTHWLNVALYHVSSFQAGRRPTVWRWSHTRHHTDTMVTGRDPEIQAQLPIRPLALLADFIGLKLWPIEVVKAVMNAFGHLGAEERTFIPESEWPKVRREGLLWTAIYGGVIAVAVATRSWLPLLFIGLPSIYGGWLYNFFGLTQHAGLPENTRDHRLNSRTVLMNPVYRFLYWNMNYHVEHHMFPMVPYHALPQLHAEIGHDLPPPYPSTWAAYREVLPALITQWRDPTFHVRRPLPPAKLTA
jgi:fatty acid desaturase